MTSLYKILSQKFGVVVRIESPELAVLVQQRLQKDFDEGKLPGILVLSVQDLPHHRAHQSQSGKPIVLLSNEGLPAGLGLVEVVFPPVEGLLGTLARTIERVLTHFDLMMYLDIFDAAKLSQLKHVLQDLGLPGLIDAVIQDAYYAGLLGDAEQATSHFDRKYKSATPSRGMARTQKTSAENFFSNVLEESSEPYAFLKAALSFYMVNYKGHTISHASRTLNVSRSTLQEHLKLANLFGVERIFNALPVSQSS